MGEFHVLRKGTTTAHFAVSWWKTFGIIKSMFTCEFKYAKYLCASDSNLSHLSLFFRIISHSNDPHWERKERLLRFDREFARRTKIFDDQSDYQGPSTWMNDDERAFAEENQAKQQDALKRPKQVLNLSL